MMEMRPYFIMFLCWLVTSAAGMVQGPDGLGAGFDHPAADTRPYVYWYWLKDNVSREGISRDLEAMARAGIGGAFIGHIFQGDMEQGPVKMFSPPWWEIVSHAVREGQRLGVEIGMFNSPGWSQSGGPWITPDKSMRYLAFYEKKVTGPVSFNGTIEAGEGYFEDVALLAFRMPALEASDWLDWEPRIQTQPEGTESHHLVDGKSETRFEFPQVRPGVDEGFIVDIHLARLMKVQSVVLYPVTANFSCAGAIQTSQDGQAFRTIREFDVMRGHQGSLTLGPLALSVPLTEAPYFRLVFEKIESASKMAVSAIELSSRAWVQEYVQKQLGVAWPTPQPMWDAYMWEPTLEPDLPGSVVDCKEVLNISDHLKVDGTIEWDVPEGEWILLRLGMRTTGSCNGPASPEGTGLECDKMSRGIAAFHFESMIGEFLKRIPESQRRAFQWVICDSYEQGLQNWTEGFDKKFRQVYGYDPLPWLPVLTGRIVVNADASERFLWDLRRLVADCIAEEYVGGIREISNRNGLKTWFENYGHWGFPSEFLMYGGQSDAIGGEFWYNTGSLGDIECRAASSASHIYGKNRVYAEAFTSNFIFNQSPGSIKSRGDRAFCEGINHFVLHVSVHQSEDGGPGIKAWFGTNFDRNNTWFSQSCGFIDYLRRCHFMLQQGVNVADVAYFIGEDTPKMIGIRQPEIPEGYSYDYINAEVLQRGITIKNGRWTLPHGGSYKVLVLPPQDTMRPELLAEIARLVSQGGILLGSAPKHSPSLQDYPDCDKRIQSQATRLWGDDAYDAGRLSRQYEQGRVYRGYSLGEVLAEQESEPDFEYKNAESGQILFVHRSLPFGGEIYFLSNQSQKPLHADCWFRVKGLQPELWDAVGGQRRTARGWNLAGNRTIVPIAFEPGESVFVAFLRPTAQQKGDLPHNRPEYETVREVPGPWKVIFDPKLGGPGEVRFEELVDWTGHSQEGIRYYSGTAVYRQAFSLTPLDIRGSLWLDLGQVHDLAAVRLNGKEVGIAWCAPWRMEISEAAKTGENILEIEVVNQWFNRLAGDAKRPSDQQVTRTGDNKPWPKPSNLDLSRPLCPSGLLGPVRILRQKVSTDPDETRID